jgi:L-arabinose transport system substrate-binding protein
MKRYAKWLGLFAAIVGMVATCGCGDKEAGSAPLKLGFIVKQPEEPWFQLEWQFADEAAKQYGYELFKIAGPDGEKVLTAIDNLAANGAKGFVICTPDVKLGPGIVAKARAHNMKLIAVDDRFIGGDGKPMEQVHYLGISARKIGNLVGETLAEEMAKRGWSAEETGCMVVTYDELDTIRERTDGVIEGLLARGFPPDRIFKAPTQKLEIPASLDAANALLTQRGEIKKWLICGGNDNAVLGAVRATEGRGLTADCVCGIGINGTDCISEFQKKTPTAFYASVLLSAKEHGFKTAEMLYKWVTEGVEPPLETRTVGVIITRDTYQQVRAEQGIKD